MLNRATLFHEPEPAFRTIRAQAHPVTRMARLQRALDYIDLHAHADIAVHDIAHHAGTSTRNLQLLFQRELGCAPREHLRRVRLEGARAELRRADRARGDTIATIAARWGFPHAGRFAIYYRHRFGCSPSDTLTLTDDGLPDAVQRAEQFIDAHAGQPIRLAQIAAAAGLTSRALRSAFARTRDTTPLAHLRRVRMEGAHRDLTAADPTHERGIDEIARRWGFTHRGRFAADYRRRYGQSPSTTLRRRTSIAR